ncbi:MAG: TonB-dependent receptor, partial [Pseudomonadota bacterium]
MHNAKKPQLVRKTALATALAAFSAPSLAQMTLEEVVVTAQKREQTVQDIPASVAAISAEMISLTNTREFSDLNKITSGITVTGGADGFGPIIRIRGVGNNAFAPAIRPSVGIFLDEVPLVELETAYNNMADIERIEILKGPQATLFGKEVSSGAISLFTKRPDTTGNDFYAEGNFGNLDLEEYRIGGNLPMGDMFALRASYYYAERGDIVTNRADVGGLGTNFGMGDYEKDGYRLRLGFEPTDTFSAILSYEKHNIELFGSAAVTQEYGDLYTTWRNNVVDDPQPGDLVPFDPFSGSTANAAPTNRETDTEIISLHVEWQLSDSWSLTSVTSSQEYTAEVTGEADLGLVDNDGNPLPDLGSTTVGPYFVAGFIQDRESTAVTQELRLNFDTDNWSSIFGFFYSDSELINFVPFTSPLGALPSGSIFQAAGDSDLTEDIEEWAFFNHNIWTIRDGLDFTFGVRYAETEKDAVKAQLTGVGVLEDLNTPPVPVTPWVDDVPKQNDTWESITGTVKLTWWVTDEVSVYGGWDRGFKAGGFNVCKGTEPEPLGCFNDDNFDEETADNFELGFKGRFFDNTLIWNGAIFYQVYDDYQVEIQDDEGIGNTIQNAAKAEIEGIETEFQWLASENLLIDGNISYVDARWDEYENAACLRPQYQAIACSPDPVSGDPVQDLSGKRLNQTSPWTANLNVTWNDTLNNGMGWYIRGEYAYRDDRFFFPDLDPELTDDDYFLLNASIGLTVQNQNWDIILWGKNLTDEEYLFNGSRNRDAGNPNFGTTPVEG